MEVGIDIIERSRINEKNEKWLIDNFLSDKEREELNRNSKRVNEYLCGRWAAKEAIYKALSPEKKVDYTKISVLNDDSGKPYVEYENYEIKISISHEKNYAVAIAILMN
ncbi:MAG: holo-ACP synthase [Erysipelotrichaceae bacterium]|nr:holo-ACP synthase [Erysipelotrichaceae bacterium]